MIVTRYCECRWPQWGFETLQPNLNYVMVCGECDCIAHPMVSVLMRTDAELSCAVCGDEIDPETQGYLEATIHNPNGAGVTLAFGSQECFLIHAAILATDYVAHGN